MRSFFRRLLGTRSISSRPALRLVARPWLETLESRDLLSTVSVDAGTVVRTVNANVLGVDLPGWDGYLAANNFSTTDTTPDPGTVSMLQQAGLKLLRLSDGSGADESHFNQEVNPNGFTSGVGVVANVAAAVNAQGLVTVNFGTGTPQEAAAYLAYLDGAANGTVNLGTDANGTNWQTSGYWASLRGQAPLAVDDGLNHLRTSHAAPYGFKYFEVGNEAYFGAWQNFQMPSPVAYADFANQFNTLAQQIAPGVSLGLDVGNPVEWDQAWNIPVLQECVAKNFTPGFLSDHFYAFDGNNETPLSDQNLLLHTVSDPNSVMPIHGDAPRNFATRAQDYRALLTQYLGANGSKVELMVGEFNSDADASTKQSSNLVHGLWVADAIGSLLQTEYDGASFWDLRNYYTTMADNASFYGWRTGADDGMIGTTSNGATTPATGPYVAYPAFFAEELASLMAHTGDSVVSALSDTATLSTYAVHEQNGHLDLLVINKAATAADTTTFNLSNFVPSSTATQWTYGEAEDTAQSQTADGSSSLTRTTPALGNLNGGNFQLTFPAYSMSVVDLTPVAATLPGVQNWGTPFSSPYVNVLEDTNFNYANAAAGGNTKYLTLGFIDANASGQPSWQGQPDTALGSPTDTAFAAQVNGLRRQGGDVMVSFGGASDAPGSPLELARAVNVLPNETVAQKVQILVSEYQQVITEYQLTHIDFDIEGPAAQDIAANDLRSQALAVLEQNNPGLQVYFTVPANAPLAPYGMTDDAASVINNALDRGVVIAGVNLMTMDFSNGWNYYDPSAANTQLYGNNGLPYAGTQAPDGVGTVAQVAIKNAQGEFTELQADLAAHNVPATPAQIWQMIGITPEVGRNYTSDNSNVIFSTADAQQVENFAQDQGIGRLSMWSAGRDQPGTPTDPNHYENNSSIAQTPYQFSQTFALLPNKAGIVGSTLVVNGGASVTIRLKSGVPSSTEVLFGPTVVGTFSNASFQSISVQPSSHDEQLTIDDSNGNPVPASGLQFSGGSGNNTLVGPGASGAWNITGANAGTLNGSIQFSNVGRLVGGKGNDTFTFAAGSTISAGIDGGAGTNTLDYSKYNARAVVDLTHGVATAVSNYAYRVIANIQAALGSNNATNLLVGTSANTLWNISGANSGTAAPTGGTAFTFSSFPTLAGGAGNDTFKFAGASASETGYIDGGAGVNTFDYSAYPGTIIVNVAANAATAVRSLNGGGAFDIQNFIGNATSANHLVGPNSTNAWNLTGANAGTFMGTGSFSGFPNLTGGTGADTFTFTAGATLSGILDGGTGAGLNTLNYGSYGARAVVDLTHGVATAVSNYAYHVLANFQAAFGSNNATNLLVGTSANTLWNITGANSGTATPTGGAAFTFSGFPTLAGGAGNDTFRFAGASASESGYIDGGAGANTFDYSTYPGTIIVNVGAYAATAVKSLAGSGVFDIQSFIGNATSTNHLVGPNTAETWNLAGANAGTFMGTGSFSGFPNLTGGTGADTFTFGAGATLAGILDGGLGAGLNTLDYTNYGARVVVDLTHGVATAVSNYAYHALADFQAALGNNNATNLLVGSSANTLWNITGANGGTATPSGGAAFTFSSFPTLAGGAGNDTFKFTGASASEAGYVDGGAGANTFDYSAYPGAIAVNVGANAATAVKSLNGGGVFEIQNFIGNSTSTNHLVGPNTTDTWNLTGSNAGTFMGTGTFSGFPNLTGGSGDDTYHFAVAASLSGYLGDIGGHNWLDYSAWTSALTANLGGGSASGVAGSVTGIQNVVGGTGNDMLTGGASGGILIGGAGTDTITAGTGRSILIGDAGSDQLTAGASGDILIGGSTSYDAPASRAALVAVLAEWQRTDINYTSRVTDIRNGTGLTGGNKLAWSTNVLDDGASNALTGNAAASGNELDWFFANQAAGHDTVLNLVTGEQIN
jgi:hypothetical protein